MEGVDYVQAFKGVRVSNLRCTEYRVSRVYMHQSRGYCTAIVYHKKF